MKKYIPTHMSALERLTDRIQAGGSAQSVLTQLELGDKISEPLSRNVMVKLCDEITVLLNQCEDLELGIKCFLTNLQSTQELLIKAKIDLRDKTERMAELSKENRNLKSSIEKLMQ